ncbi:MAG TPA: hypothetical protein VGO59_11995 [Verrucomicrobiae bacterium]|jgi:hypothetical protein
MVYGIQKNKFLVLAWLAAGAAHAQDASFALGAASLLAGLAANANSIVLAAAPQSGSWSAAANAPWLHLAPASQAGTGSACVVFGCDANSGRTRAGSLAVAGSGNVYFTERFPATVYEWVAARGSVTPCAFGPFSQLDILSVAADGIGDVYISDNNGAIMEPPRVRGSVSEIGELRGWQRCVASDPAWHNQPVRGIRSGERPALAVR